jgi:hypothetical protein
MRLHTAAFPIFVTHFRLCFWTTIDCVIDPIGRHVKGLETSSYLLVLDKTSKKNKNIYHEFENLQNTLNIFKKYFFNWVPRREGVLEKWRYSCTHSLTSALDVGEWSASRPGCFIPRERASGTHWIGGWVDPTVLDAVVKRKIPSPRRESNTRTTIVQPVAQ